MKPAAPVTATTPPFGTADMRRASHAPGYCAALGRPDRSGHHREDRRMRVEVPKGMRSGRFREVNEDVIAEYRSTGGREVSERRSWRHRVSVPIRSSVP